MNGQLTTPADVRQFTLAGNAIITLRSQVTGNRFTYKVRKARDGQLWFVGLLRGPGNETDYTYMGVIHSGASDCFISTAKSRVKKDAPSYRAFEWTWHHVLAGRLPEEVEVWHEGRCGRCGRTLTVPESIQRGIGPECAAKMGLAV